MSDPSYYHREYSPYGSYSLFPFEGSDFISVLKNSIEYSFVFLKCLIVQSQLPFLFNLHLFLILISLHQVLSLF